MPLPSRMPTTLFWGDWLRLMLCVSASLLSSTVAWSDSRTLKVSADWGRSSGYMTGVWDVAGAIRPTPDNRPSDSQKNISLITTKETGFSEWELTQSKQLQNVQVLGRINIGPFVGFIPIYEAESFVIQDTRLAWRFAKYHDLTSHTRWYGSAGLSGHLLRVNYSGDDSEMGYAVAISPQLKAGLETRWSNGLRSTLSVQADRSLPFKNFKMQARRIEAQIQHRLTEHTDLSFGLFTKAQRYNYAKENNRIDFETDTTGLSVAFEKRF